MCLCLLARPDRFGAQLPEGISWRENLPEILEWVNDESVPGAVDRALDQRFYLMWGASAGAAPAASSPTRRTELREIAGGAAHALLHESAPTTTPCALGGN